MDEKELHKREQELVRREQELNAKGDALDEQENQMAVASATVPTCPKCKAAPMIPTRDGKNKCQCRKEFTAAYLKKRPASKEAARRIEMAKRGKAA